MIRAYTMSARSPWVLGTCSLCTVDLPSCGRNDNDLQDAMPDIVLSCEMNACAGRG